MEHRSPKISKELQDENVMLAKQLKQTEQYYKRMLEQRDNAIHKLDNEQNRSKELRFKFVAQIKKARRLDELIFELKMKNADMVLALNKAEKKNKNLTAQIADLFNAGEEAFDVPSVSQPTDASVSSDSKTDTVSSHPISPPSSPIAKRTGQVIKDKNGTPQKPRKRLVSPPSSSIAKRTGQAVIKQENGAPEKPRKRRLRGTQTSTRRSSQRLKIKQKWKKSLLLFLLILHIQLFYAYCLWGIIIYSMILISFYNVIIFHSDCIFFFEIYYGIN